MRAVTLSLMTLLLAGGPASAQPASRPAKAPVSGPSERPAARPVTADRPVAARPAESRPGDPAPRDAPSPNVSPPPPAEGTTPPPAVGATPDAMTPKIKKKSYSHRLQVSVDLSVGLGYAFLVTYKDTVWCGAVADDGDNESFCTGMAPVVMDFGLAFGVLDSLDIIAEFRLGLTKDPVNNRPLIFMPGLRVWIDPEKKFKIGLGFQLVLDFTKQDSPQQLDNGLPEKGETLDIGARFYAQFQYDFVRYFGLFGRIGLLGTFRRWVQLNLEGQLGVQARFP